MKPVRFSYRLLFSYALLRSRSGNVSPFEFASRGLTLHAKFSLKTCHIFSQCYRYLESALPRFFSISVVASDAYLSLQASLHDKYAPDAGLITYIFNLNFFGIQLRIKSHSFPTTSPSTWTGRGFDVCISTSLHLYRWKPVRVT